SEAIAEGGLRSDFTPGLVTRLLFGMINSITEWYRPSYPVDPDTIAEAVTTMAFQGLDTCGSGVRRPSPHEPTDRLSDPPRRGAHAGPGPRISRSGIGLLGRSDA